MGLRDRTLFDEDRCFFVTTTCHEFLPLLRGNDYYAIIYEAMNHVNQIYKAGPMGYVLMQEHIHLIVYFEQENRLSDYMRDLKKYTARQIRLLLERDGETELLDRLEYPHREQQYKVWKDRFDDVVIRSQKVLETKLNYIHDNPVKAGLSQTPEEYMHSSAGFYFEEKPGSIEVLDFREVFP